jgi:phosphoribosylaminoimidazolecarboxamide formyltransferase/IMP cyclohydrolase
VSKRQISNALISVFNKDGLDTILDKLVDHHIHIFSTGGTQKFIERKGITVSAVEDLTSYPSILGGRVKTLHPKVFGGILARRENETDEQEVQDYEIPFFDLVIVDLYPFEDTVASGASHEDIIEKIDIGGISLIRAAAKNYADVAVISSKDDYSKLQTILERGNYTTLEERKELSANAFNVSSHYDTMISMYMQGGSIKPLRYGENPHQKATFNGNLNEVFEQFHGKELSYNNLLDIDATLNYLKEFEEQCVAIIKHNNACGFAVDENLPNAWRKALAGDPVSAFGGIIGINRKLDEETATLINELFFEVIIATDYDEKALEILKSKKNRVILKLKNFVPTKVEERTLLNGKLVQDKDLIQEQADDLELVTKRAASASQVDDLLFANKIVKNSKSNTIVLAKNQQLLGLGCGMTSRVDALNHAIKKSKEFNLDLNGAVMSSDAFFPFPDCVEIADKEGIEAVIHPGGSIRDKDSINYCDEHNMAMVITGNRHFKH